MNKEKYRPEHEVYFLGTAVLFPETLTTKPLDPWFFRPFFNFVDALRNEGEALEFVELVMDEYQNKGYATYEKEYGLFKVTGLNQELIKQDLIKYLQLWRADQLLSMSATKPIDAQRQINLLEKAVAHAHAVSSEIPRIKASDVYGPLEQLPYVPTFWELVLSYHFLDEACQITAMQYDGNINGIHLDKAEPFADINIFEDRLREASPDNASRSERKVDETKLVKTVGLRCDFHISEQGLVHRSGDIACKSMRGEMRSLLTYLQENKKVICDGKVDPGTPLSRGELQKKFPKIADMSRELKRISKTLANSPYAHSVQLELPKSVRLNTICQIVYWQ
jgi:hypothetical protein